jgi:hypothetical protein
MNDLKRPQVSGGVLCFFRFHALDKYTTTVHILGIRARTIKKLHMRLKQNV